MIFLFFFFPFRRSALFPFFRAIAGAAKKPAEIEKSFFFLLAERTGRRPLSPMNREPPSTSPFGEKLPFLSACRCCRRMIPSDQCCSLKKLFFPRATRRFFACSGDGVVPPFGDDEDLPGFFSLV